ncbi:MAG: UDP-N-acetylmuramoyl-L-alanyl-D-glutamate--2,6-diaminopimelate ligase [Candidatus Gracilibacteria bacterium]|nr:UDP-N-acetylmuramoyl-L-alanyl-D-glutamate--2,6-diaminopimelate ligase [Candidatus Gracilibacteria bacterium]
MMNSSPILFLKKFISLNSPIRILYHFMRGVLANLMYGNPSKDMVVIGITGTKGKTTTTNIVARGLKQSGKKVFMFSTVNYMIGDDFFDNNSKMTSPSPFMLQKLLKKAKNAGCEYAVIETSSHSIYYNRNYGIDFDVVAFTNLSQDHLDIHKSMDEYAKVKYRLFENLVKYKRKPGVKKVSIVNLDDAYGELFLQAIADNIYTFGLGNNAHIKALNIAYGKDFTTFDIKMPSNTLSVKTRLKGEFNVYNILAAVCVLISQRIPVEGIVETIEQITGIPGRLEEVENSSGFKIFVDYAHTEQSLKSVLETIRKMEGIGRIITVFGATGDRDKTKRPKMGKTVDELSDVIIVTDDDTYTEDSLSIINQVAKGITRKEGEDFWIVPDRADAIRTGLIMAKENDVILISGKGAETVQVTNSGSIPWSDVGVTKAILSEIRDNELVI